MLASVIVPVLNEGPRLRRCVEAVLAQQVRGPFEVLVVDGGSTDGCLESLRGLPARVLLAPGTGAGEARNLGARAAKGEVLVFTDADCLPQRGWLQGMLDALEARPGLAGLGGALRHLWAGRPGLCEDLETAAYYRGIITSNVAYRRAAFLGAGGFDPALRCAEDWDLGWRLEEAGHRLGHEPGAVVVHHPSEDGMYPPFLRKQVWYARQDVPALLGTWLGRRSAAGTGRGRQHAGVHLRTAWLHAAVFACLASLVLAPVGAFLALAWAGSRTLHIAFSLPEARGRAPLLFAHLAAKAVVRGYGTWRGLADVARAPWAMGFPRRAPGPEAPAPGVLASAALAAPPLQMEQEREP